MTATAGVDVAGGCSTFAGELASCQIAGVFTVAFITFTLVDFACVSCDGELYARRIGNRDVFSPPFVLLSDRVPGLPIIDGDVATMAVACASGEGLGIRVPGVDFRGVVREAASAARALGLLLFLFGESGDVARDCGADLLRGGEVAGEVVDPGDMAREPAFFFRLLFLASAAINAAMFGLTYPPPPRDAEGRSIALELPLRALCTARPDETGFGDATRFGVSVPANAGEDEPSRMVDSKFELRFLSIVLLKSGAGDVVARLNVLPTCGDPRL